MTYRSRYVGRFNGIGRMLTRPWLHVPCLAAAEKIMSAAQQHAPVGDPDADPHPGLYRDSFEVHTHVKNAPFHGKPALRAGAIVVNTASYARSVEYGNGKVPRYNVFRKAIDDVKGSHV
ncbi:MULTISPECIES: HK97 gp10 family phage protein [unclassified Streptomyces]|uniref:HK97 gp10 family phage protein n=1 Tax=unclassified Streptomyces TaxID=2593676 RepID=UPI0033F1A1B8